MLFFIVLSRLIRDDIFVCCIFVCVLSRPWPIERWSRVKQQQQKIDQKRKTNVRVKQKRICSFHKKSGLNGPKEWVKQKQKSHAHYYYVDEYDMNWQQFSNWQMQMNNSNKREGNKRDRWTSQLSFKINICKQSEWLMWHSVFDLFFFYHHNEA